MQMKKLSTKNIVEFIGMLGIIGSVVFVGIEVSQNSSIARAASYQSYIYGFTQLNLVQVTDDELNSLMVRIETGTSTSDLTPGQRRKIVFFYITLLRQWEGLYRSVNEGILPDEMLTIVGAGHLLSYPAFKTIWPEIRPLFTKDFASFVDKVHNR